MILAKTAILDAINAGEIVIQSPNDVKVSHNSIDLHLAPNICEIVGYNTVDAATGEFTILPKHIDLRDYPNGFKLNPENLYLAVTKEYLGSSKYVAQLADKSSAVRMGLSTHFNGGFGDLGFFGHWTLEIRCSLTTIIYPNMKICQVSFQEAKGNADYADGGRYSNNFTENPIPTLSKGLGF